METTRRSSEDFAKNYPLIDRDGTFGPYSVGNIGKYNGKTLINLCLKTNKSGEKNAVYSVPSDWKDATAFSAGDQVNVTIVNGYVKKIRLAAVTFYSATKSASAMTAEAIEKAGAQMDNTLAEESRTLATVTEGEDNPF